MQQITEARNASEVSSMLLTIFNDLCNKRMEAKEAVEINNTAGKINSFLKVQLAYHAMRGETPDIEFLNCEPTTKAIEHKQARAITKQ